jgi:excisionase family DNA binding protein
MFLRVKEVSERLGVSAGCVYQLVHCGELEHIRVGVGRGTIRIPEESLATYIEQGGRQSRCKLGKRLNQNRRGTFRHLDPARLNRAWTQADGVRDGLECPLE